MPKNMSSSNSPDGRRARAAHGFATLLRWLTGLYAAATLIAIIVLAIRVPNCIGVGVSILKGEDCTNRETYYLILAAGAGVSIGFSLLLLVGAYAIDLLAILAFGRPDDTKADEGSG